jgi:hypothetical protein
MHGPTQESAHEPALLVESLHPRQTSFREQTVEALERLIGMLEKTSG